MTKSTITREESVQAVFDLKVGYRLGFADIEILKRVARMALAEKASEPVILYRERNPYNGLTTGWQELTENEFLFLKENAGENAEFLTLYRHAQPAPVVMDDTKLRELFDSWFASDCSFDLSPEASEADNIAWRESYWYVWQRCRAAMLQELKKSAGTEAICRSDENVQVLHTKSPAQSDCCPAQNQGWIQVSERMPEKGQAVLVYRPKAHEGGDSDVRVAVYGRHNFEHGFGCYWEPSHWMPLPAAPQEVSDA
ncbi:DUF551 domain-containing protein [Klebsiella pneumoniae]|uniref:DUF551 domain-containing protein n=1 Tax=Klebsiella pneumoniae TaxID=573 RepID=UPI001D0F29D2|nr:DUF551 domain-containing protein [Klebsiella pneumoniae]